MNPKSFPEIALPPRSYIRRLFIWKLIGDYIGIVFLHLQSLHQLSSGTWLLTLRNLYIAPSLLLFARRSSLLLIQGIEKLKKEKLLYCAFAFAWNFYNLSDKLAFGINYFFKGTFDPIECVGYRKILVLFQFVKIFLVKSVLFV